jgi:O-antigen ligase
MAEIGHVFGISGPGAAAKRSGGRSNNTGGSTATHHVRTLTLALAVDAAPASLTDDLRRAARTATAPALLAVAGLIAAAVIAAGAPRPLLVLALLPMALAVVPAIVASPRLAVATMVSLTLANANDVLADHGVRGVEFGIALIGVSALAGAVRRKEVALRWTPVHTVAVLFLLSRTATILAAQQPAVAMADAVELARVLVFFFLIAGLAGAAGGVRAIVVAGLATAAGLAALAVVQEALIGNEFEFLGFSRVPKTADRGGFTARHSGPETDANFWGRTLVLWVPVAAGLALPHLRRARGIAAAGAGAMVVAGIYLTQSRGALLAAAMAGVLFLLLAGERYRRYLFVVPVVVVFALALPGVGSRLATLGQLGEATQRAGEGSLVSRFEVMRQGATMFLEHPATGVGAHNFRLADAEYARRSGLLGVEPMAAHNAYIEMAAEGGIIGLATWLLFLGAPAYVALRVVRSGDGEDRLTAAAVISGLAGWGFASLFLHISDLRPILLFGAIAVVVDGRRLAPDRVPRPLMSPARRLALAGSALAVLGAGAAAVGASFDARWTATSSALIRPVRSDGEPSAYDLDVATRPIVGDTIAELVRRTPAAADRGELLSARAVPGRGIIEVVARGENRVDAEQRAGRALRAGDVALAAGRRSWRLDRPFQTVAQRSRVLDPDGAAAPAAVAVVAALAMGAALRGERRKATAQGLIRSD